MTKKLLKTIYYIFYVLMIVIVIVLVLSILPSSSLPKTFAVQSGSMEPAIKTGSIILVNTTKEYAIDDIITFGPYTKTKPPTTHRIIAIRVQDGAKVYTTKGDANTSKDIKEVSEKYIIGKVLFTLPFGGYIIDFIKKPLGLIIIIILPAIFIVYDEIKKVIKEVKKIKQRKVNIEEKNKKNEL